MTDLTLPSDDGPARRGQVALPVGALRHGRAVRMPAPVRLPSSMMEGVAPPRSDSPRPGRIQVLGAVVLLVASMLTGVLLEPSWRNGRSSLPTAAIALVQAMPGLGPWFTASLLAGSAQAATSAPAGLQKSNVTPDELLPEALLELTPDQARLQNSAMPIAKTKSAAALPFMMPHTDLISRQRAVQCLTAAVYYEASQEPTAGQRGVAQVVINRMRHPAYPKTVCGVVFQGHERNTGCQFTFTCDGALARKPNPILWARSQQIAEAALNGWVERSVGLSTHYHADYVVPKWASSLVKTSVQGAHIFYRWAGGWGTPVAFNGKWAGTEENVPGLPAIEAEQEPVLVLASVETAAPAPAFTPEPMPFITAPTGVAETVVAIAPVVHTAPALQPAVDAAGKPVVNAPPKPTNARPRRLAVPSNW